MVVIARELDLSSVQFSRSVMSNSLRPHEPQHTRPPCPSATPRVYPNSCPLNWWCYLTISSSVVPFSSCLRSFPASGSFQMSQLFASGGQNIGVSASTSTCLAVSNSLQPHGLCSLPGSSIHGIFQAVVLEWIAISFSSGSSRPRDGTQVSRFVDRHFTVWATREGWFH